MDRRPDDPFRARRKAHFLPADFPVDTESVWQPPFGAHGEPHPIVVHVEVGVAASTTRCADPQAIDYGIAKRSLHLDGDIPVPTPGCRCRDPAACTEWFENAGQRSERDAVALLVIDERRHHRTPADTGESACDRVREAGSGLLAYHDDEGYLVRGTERTVAAANVDFLEASGGCEPRPHGKCQIRTGSITHRHARERQDFGVRYGHVAVDADVDHGGRRRGGLRGAELDGKRSDRCRNRRGEDDRCVRAHQPGYRPAPGHRTGARDRRLPAVTACR